MPRINGLNAHSTHAHADYTSGLNVFCNSAVQLCAASGKKQNNFLLSNWSLLILVSKTAAFASKHKNEPCDGSKTGSHDQILTFSKNLSLDNQNYLMTAWLAKKSASWSKKLYAGKWWDMNTCALYAWIFPSLFSCSEQLRLEWGARLSTVDSSSSSHKRMDIIMVSYDRGQNHDQLNKVLRNYLHLHHTRQDASIFPIHLHFSNLLFSKSIFIW